LGINGANGMKALGRSSTIIRRIWQKQKWMWDALTSPDLAAAQFHNPGSVAIFPMNVSSTIRMT
jgi:hypothetical protein